MKDFYNYLIFSSNKFNVFFFVFATINIVNTSFTKGEFNKMKLREVYQNKLRHLAFGIGKPEEVIEVGTQAGIQEEQLKQDIASAVTTADLLRKSFSARNSLLTDFARELPPLTQAEIDNNIYWLQLSRLSGDNESIDFFGRSVPKEEVKNLVKDKDVSEEEVVEAGVKAGIPENQIQNQISFARSFSAFRKT